MGMPGPCSYSESTQKPSIPDPEKFTILDKAVFRNSYALKLRYENCTNYDGVKVGVFIGEYKNFKYRDPHFHEGDPRSPIARFVPDDWGWAAAKAMAEAMSEGEK